MHWELTQNLLWFFFLMINVKFLALWIKWWCRSITKMRHCKSYGVPGFSLIFGHFTKVSFNAKAKLYIYAQKWYVYMYVGICTCWYYFVCFLKYWCNVTLYIFIKTKSQNNIHKCMCIPTILMHVCRSGVVHIGCSPTCIFLCMFLIFF